MEQYSDCFSRYTMGEDAYEEIKQICSQYGNRAVIIGGKTALSKTEADIRKSGMEITGSLWYGGEASYENVSALAERAEVQNADMIFAVGGGKALDTAKCLAVKTGKSIFTFPTIASTCAASTSVSIMYHQDGTFFEPFFFEKPPAHIFIRPSVLAAAPEKYLWAGMGDSLAKYLESEMSSRDETVPDYIKAGVEYAKDAYGVIMGHGREAYAANKIGRTCDAFDKVAEAVIMTVGKASILLCTDHVIDYNTGLAHAVFYAMTAFEHIEKNHLHGEVVGFGCLVLTLADKNPEFERLYQFNRWCGLPTVASQLEFTPEMITDIIPRILQMRDIEHSPYQITEDLLKRTFLRLENISLERKYEK